METKRQQKVARLLQKELAAILQKDGKIMFGSALVTVTHVSISKDFSFARVYLSIFGVDDKELILKNLETNKREMRFWLGKRVKNQLRIIPELVFALDNTLDYIENIDNLLKQ